MYKPLLKGARRVTKKLINQFGDGINTFNPPLNILDSQSSDLSNVDSSKYPALNVRNGKTSYATALTTPNALGQRLNTNLHVVDGTTWKYWNGSAYVNVATSLTNAGGAFEEFATGTTKYTIFSNGTERKAWNGTTVTDLTNAPTGTIIFTSHKGRIYWARGYDIVFSALNSINDYSTPNDSGTLDITRAKGVITGMFEFNGKLIVFTEYGAHELYGTGPTNFELIDIEGDVGCISDKSIITCNRMLYFVGLDGVYEYNGASMSKISEPSLSNGVTGGVTTFIKGIKTSLKSKVVSGAIGDYLYISIPYGSSASNNNKTLVFDIKLRKWYVRDDYFFDFETIGSTLYGVNTSGSLFDMTTTATSDNGSSIDWYFITKPFTDFVAKESKTISDIWIIYDLPIGSTFTLSYSSTVDGNDFTTLKTFTASADEQNTRIQIPVNVLQNVTFYRFKFSGSGQCTIYFMEQFYRVG